MKYYIIVLICLLCFSGHANADSPLPAPERLTICSSMKTFCAVSDPDKKITTFFDNRSKKNLWSIPGWHRWLLVSNDGESVAIGYGGLNLVPYDVSLKEPVIHFYHRGKRVHSVLLGDIYQNITQMRETASHRVWLNNLSINKANQLVLQLPNNKQIAYRMKTGLVETIIPDKTGKPTSNTPAARP
jgi:hypothetical protein